MENERKPLLSPNSTKQHDAIDVGAGAAFQQERVRLLLRVLETDILQAHALDRLTTAVSRERDCRREAASKLWGDDVPPLYEPTDEDRASLFSRMTYRWIGDYIFVAAREEMTVDLMPRPTMGARSWDIGRRLSRSVEEALEARHSWDGFIGYPVCVVVPKDGEKAAKQRASPTSWAASEWARVVRDEGRIVDVHRVGFLRWVGTLQCRASPSRVTTGELYAAVEWLVPKPHQQNVGSSATADFMTAIDASDGVVDGEHLFHPIAPSKEGFVCSSCIPVAQVRLIDPLWTGTTSSPWQPEGAATAPARLLTINTDNTPSLSQRTLRSEATADNHVEPVPTSPPQPLNFAKALWRVHRRMLLVQIPLKFTSDYINLASPVILGYLIDFLASNDAKWGIGMLILGGIFLSNVVQTVITQKFYDMNIQAGLIVRSSVVGLVFEKSQMISSKALTHPDFNVGRLVNMISTDAERTNDFCWYWLYIVAAPQQLIIAIGLLYRLVGWCAFAGVAVVLIVMPAQGYVTRKQQLLRQSLSKITDKRVKYTTELFSGIRTVKYMGWELHFLEKIQRLRKEEIEFLRNIQRYRVLQALVNVAAPSLVVGAVLVTFHVSGHTLTPGIVFPTIALLSIMRIPFAAVPFALTSLVQMLVALQRIARVLEADNDTLSNIHDVESWYEKAAASGGKRDLLSSEDSVPCLCSHACVFEDATIGAFTAAALRCSSISAAPTADPSALRKALNRMRSACSCLACRQRQNVSDKSSNNNNGTTAKNSSATPPAFYELKVTSILNKVNLAFPSGKLSVIVGATGTGKSTLLEAVLGMMHIERGGAIYAPRSRGDLAYVPQQPWIMNATLRDNIVFYGEEDPSWLQETLRACDLEEDVKHLVCGLDTEIGEKGVTLSGGQRARVSLARAVYAKRDVLLLDDPLSALDAHVSEKIVHGCLLKLLRGKTRLLCTHHLHVLPLADYIVVLGPQSGNGSNGVEERHNHTNNANEVLFAGSYDAYVAAFPRGHHVVADAAQGGGGMERQTTTASFVGDSSPTTPIIPPNSPAAGDALPQALVDVGASRNHIDETGSNDDEEDEEAILGDDNDALDDSVEQKHQPNRSGSFDGPTASAASATPLPAKADAATAASKSNSGGALMTVEEKAVGAVPWQTYLRYAECCGGLSVVVGVLLVFTVTEVMNVANTVWLSLWSTGAYGLSQSVYLYGFVGCIAGATVAGPVRYYVAYAAMRKGSLHLHQRVLFSVAAAPMSFFDTTPLGRILNRFSRDVDMCDNDLQMSFISFLSTLFSALSSMAVMIASQPYCLVVMGPCSVVYVKLMVFYNKANREVRRISTTLKSPMYALLTESLSGYRTIRAYGKGPAVMKAAMGRLDAIYAAGYMQNIANRWLALRIEAMATLIITSIAAAAIFEKLCGGSTSDVGLLALGFTLSLSVTQTLNWIVRMTAAVEADMNSVERLFYYTDAIPHEPLDDLLRQMDPSHKHVEACVTTRSVGLQCPEDSSMHHARLLCPSTAVVAADAVAHVAYGADDKMAIRFRGVGMRYRPELPAVLRNLSFDIARGDKVGVVGRTGSGKSSLLLTFLRVVDTFEGSISVLGKDIQSYDLHELRDCFSMIPQDPLLFDGTVRSNLDPLEKYSSEALLNVLDMVGLRQRIEREHDGLDSAVAEHGQNFSVGQRQLLCLARALLRQHSAVVLMDEATANIDPQLDRQIQRTLRTAFRHHSVITIAHRLHTVLTYSKIMVLDHGAVAEYGAPWELARRSESILRRMIASHGPEGEAKLMRMVERAAARSTVKKPK